MAPLTLLLALDNAEHLVTDMARVRQTLRDAAPGLRFVVTSQAPLNIPSERVYRIGPLAVPEGPLPAEQALAYGAVSLFTERAQAADTRFVLTDVNAPAVIELCRELDGLALAIELAAARAPMLGLHGLRSSMKDRLKLLTRSRNRAAPARQQTLRATLEWSHGLLAPREQVVFRRLAVVVGSASLELIQQVVADPRGEGELDDWAVLDALSILVDRSLVAVLSADTSDRVSGATPRYRLLDSSRALASERLVMAGELEALERRHALAVADLFGAVWDDQFSGRIGHDDWTGKLSADLDNARAGLAWVRAMGDIGSELAISTTLMLALPRAQYAERAALGDRCEAALGLGAPERLQWRACVAFCAMGGSAQRHRRRHHSAMRGVSLARALFVEQPDAFPLYLSLSQFAYASAFVDQLPDSTAALFEMRSLEDPAWPPQRLFWGAYAEGLVAGLRCKPADAARHTRRAVALDHARGASSSWSLLNLIDYELAAGDPAAAVRSGRELVAALGRTRDEQSLTFARINLTAASLALGDHESARIVAQAGWPHAVKFALQAYWADYLALLSALESRPQAAARLAGYADAVYFRLDAKRQPTEAAAMERTHALACATLGEATYARLRAEGGTLRDEDVAALAFELP